MSISEASAALRNFQAMSDEKLLREYRIVSGFPEQPPFRLEYLAVLREELRRRHLDPPRAAGEGDT